MVDFIFIFNNITLDLNENKISNKNQNINIEPRLVNLLSFFSSHSNTVFSREELINEVWGNAVVSEQVVTQSVFELRKILTQLGAPDIIATIPKRGYKFTADVSKCLIQDSASIETIAKTNNHVVMAFPAAPISRALANHVASTSEFHPINELKKVKKFLAVRLFDIFMLMSLVIIIGYSVVFQNEAKNANEHDSQLIAIEAKINSTLADNVGLYPYGIGKQIENAIEKYTGYRTRNTLTTPSIPGKALILSIKPSSVGEQLTVKLVNKVTNDVFLLAKLPINDKALLDTITQATNLVLKKLHGPKLDKQQILSLLPNNKENIKYLLIANYLLSQSEPKDLAKSVGIYNDLLNDNPNNSYLLALRYIAFTEKLIIEGGNLRNNTTFIKYGKALTPFKKLNNLKPIVYQALALKAFYDGDKTQSLSMLKKAKEDADFQSSLGYIILGKLLEHNDRECAHDAYNQASYLNKSAKNHLLIEKMHAF